MSSSNKGQFPYRVKIVSTGQTNDVSADGSTLSTRARSSTDAVDVAVEICQKLNLQKGQELYVHIYDPKENKVYSGKFEEDELKELIN